MLLKMTQPVQLSFISIYFGSLQGTPKEGLSTCDPEVTADTLVAETLCSTNLQAIDDPEIQSEASTADCPSENRGV